MEKKVYSRGVLERVSRVTVNTTFFPPHGANYKNGSSCGFLFCLATSSDENAITSAKFDNCHYFDHMHVSSGDLQFMSFYYLWKVFGSEK